MVDLTVPAGFKAMRIQDADGDGVLDREDRSPETTRGVRIIERGCEWRRDLHRPRPLLDDGDGGAAEAA